MLRNPLWQRWCVCNQLLWQALQDIQKSMSFPNKKMWRRVEVLKRRDNDLWKRLQRLDNDAT